MNTNYSWVVIEDDKRMIFFKTHKEAKLYGMTTQGAYWRLAQIQEIYERQWGQVPFDPTGTGSLTKSQEAALEEYYNYNQYSGPTEEDPF